LDSSYEWVVDFLDLNPQTNLRIIKAAKIDYAVSDRVEAFGAGYNRRDSTPGG